MSVDNSTENILLGSMIPQVSQSLTQICNLTYIHYVLSHMQEPSGEFILWMNQNGIRQNQLDSLRKGTGATTLRKEHKTRSPGSVIP